jgi:serine/threonine protein kinase
VAKVAHPGIPSLAFSHELQAMRAIAHPNVIRCYDSFEYEDRVVLVFEYCRGGNLQKELAERRAATGAGLPLERFKAIASQIISALSALHEQGLAHMAVKPGNVLFADEERHVVRLADFGCARSASPSRRRVGSLAYLAPETLVTPEYDPQKADIWSLGVLFAAMVQGVLPWTAGDDAAMMERQILQCEAEVSCIDDGLLRLIQRMICYLPHRLTMDELARWPLRGDDIQGVLSSPSVGASLTPLHTLGGKGRSPFSPLPMLPLGGPAFGSALSDRRTPRPVLFD